MGDPKILYKYRKLEKEEHLTMLSDRTLYLAAPSSFDDEKECKMVIRYDLMKKAEVEAWYDNDLKEKQPNLSRQERRQKARELAKNSPAKNKELFARWAEEEITEFDSRMGICSLAMKPTISRMWKEYANEGYGFCVGFSTDQIKQYVGTWRKVEYVEELPIILYNDSFGTRHFKRVFLKEKKWVFEDEFRVHKFSKNPYTESERKITLPPEAFMELIFGWKVEQEERMRIIKMCRAQGMPIQIKEAILDDGEVRIRNVEGRDG